MKEINGNIFNTKCQTIVNTVNCYGVMGAGIALECKYRYPDMYLRYKELCAKKLIDIGKLYIYKTNKKWILNFPTKKHWKYNSKIEYLEKGLGKFISTYESKGVRSVAFPLLGANNGGLTTEVSMEILRHYLKNINIPVEIYHYDPKARDELIDSFKYAILNQNPKLLANLIGIKKEKLEIIIQEVRYNNLRKMMDLTRIKGIGNVTIEKCFQYTMGGDIQNIQLNLF